MFRFFCLASLLILLTACSSAMGRSTQEVRFETPGANDAFCYADNGEVIYRIITPKTITMTKTSHDLEVHCLADGNREKSITIDPGHEPVVLANALNGFIPGMFIDSQTGAMFTYPDVITVDFRDMPVKAQAKPHYEKHLEQNPHMFGMEEFRAGRAALISDKYATTPVLRRREIPGLNTSVAVGESGAAPVEALTEVDASVPAISADPVDNPDSDMVSDLTRRMNPKVFGTTTAEGGESGDDGFTSGTAPVPGNDAPVSLYPPQ